MLIRRIAGATRELEKHRKKYMTLAIRDCVATSLDGEETPYMTSAWEPTPVELAVLQQGGSIVCNMVTAEGEDTACMKKPDMAELARMVRGASVLLSIPGTIHPPVWVFAVAKKTADEVDETLIKGTAVVTIDHAIPV